MEADGRKAHRLAAGVKSRRAEIASSSLPSTFLALLNGDDASEGLACSPRDQQLSHDKLKKKRRPKRWRVTSP